jgi:hypothetical protein
MVNILVCGFVCVKVIVKIRRPAAAAAAAAVIVVVARWLGAFEVGVGGRAGRGGARESGESSKSTR